MKMLFLFMSVICAIALSALSIVYATGNLRFVRVPDSSAEVEARPAKERFSVFSGQKQVVDQLIDTLNGERDLYRRKHGELAAREQQIARQQAIMADLRAELQKIQSELSESVLVVADSEKENLKHLAAVYSKMEPGSAATLLREIEPERAATILNMVGERQAAAILNAVVEDGAKGAEVAATWSDFIRRIGKTEKEG